jgi:hypothetical protein
MTLSEVLEELGIPFKRTGEHKNVRAGWISCECPRCSPGSGKYLLGLIGGSAYCWQCGRITLYNALCEAYGGPSRDVAALLANLPHEAPLTRPSGRLALPTGVGPLLPCHKSYLLSRGLDPCILEEVWGVRGIGLQARLAWRLFLPVTYRGQTVSWTTRSMGSEGMRYVSAKPEEEGMPIKSTLYGFDLARHACIAVEGPLDALKIGPGAVATFGLGFTQVQVRLLAKFPVRTVAFDAEPNAQRRADALCHALACFPGRTRRVEIPAGDPGDLKPRDVRAIRKEFLR